MKFSKLALRITLALALTTPIAFAQSAPTALAQSAPTDAKPPADTYETYHLANVSQRDEMNQVITAMRNIVSPRTRLTLVSSQNAIVMQGAPDQIALAKKILSDLDRPRKTYRLTYTVRDMDADKQVGIQHFSLLVVSGARTTLRNGSKIPIPDDSASNSTYKYLDIGLNIDASLDESASGVSLRSRIDRSNVVEEKSLGNTQTPVIRQATLEGTSILTQGKTVVLGSIDIPGSTRHTDIEVVLAVVP